MPRESPRTLQRRAPLSQPVVSARVALDQRGSRKEPHARLVRKLATEGDQTVVRVICIGCFVLLFGCASSKPGK